LDIRIVNMEHRRDLPKGGVMKKLLLGTVCLALLGLQAEPLSAAPLSVIGTDHSSDTYAGDVGWLALPSGTFMLQAYGDYTQSSNYLTQPNNVFAKLTGGQTSVPSLFKYESASFSGSYYFDAFGRKFVLQAGGTYAGSLDPTDVNIGNLPTPIGGLGPQTTHSGWLDPEVSAGVGLLNDPRAGRFLQFTTYYYININNFDKFKQYNVSPPGMSTLVPELAYAERLSSTINVWVDLIGNVSLHTHGAPPLALAPGVQFDNFSQGTSYDVKAFLRYGDLQTGRIAVGIEKSWGGEQTASGGVLQAIFGGPTTFGDDDYLKGHLQWTMALPADFQFAADVTHDFERKEGFREDFGIQLRLTMLFEPPAPPARAPLLTKAPAK
jgi:hypothetical protein